MTPPLGTIVDAGSGALLVALGAAVLAARPTRRGPLLFALFAGSLGFGFLVGNLGAGDRSAAIGNAALFVPAALALALLAPTLPRARPSREALAISFGFAALLVVWRTWGSQAAMYCLGPSIECRGALANLLAPYGDDTGFVVTDSLLLGALVFALLALALAPEPRSVGLPATASAALLLYPGFRAGVDLTTPASRFVANVGLSAAIALAIVGGAWLATSRRGPPERSRAARNVALVAFLAPVAGVLASLALGGSLAVYGSGLVGATRVAAVALLALAIAREGLLDVGWRRRPVACALAGALAAAAAAWAAQVAAINPVVAVFAAGLALVAVVPVHLLPDGAGRDEEDRRRLDVYRAALAEVDPRDGAAAARVLAALRSRLGITEREHARLAAEAHASALAFEPGAVALGKYRLVSVLGEGGFGRTFLARDERVERDVVLKVAHAPSAEESARLLREARLLARIRHRNVLAVHDVEELGSRVVLVLEHADGGSLADRLARGPLAAAEAVRVAGEVLAGLAAAHARGVVHRDVKPANVLFVDGVAKVADFGVARAEAGTGTVAALSLAPAQAGTVRYMAPEQARGGAADARSDVYAVGVLLYECLAGRSYLDLASKSEFEARLAIVEDTPLLPIEGVPRELNELLRAALAKDPAARPASAEAFRVALAEASAGVR